MAEGFKTQFTLYKTTFCYQIIKEWAILSFSCILILIRRDTDPRRGPCEDGPEVSVSINQGHPGPPEAEGGKEGSSPRGFWASTGLPVPWLSSSSLQNWERRHFCHFKPLSWWHFLSATMGNSYEDVGGLWYTDESEALWVASIWQH